MTRKNILGLVLIAITVTATIWSCKKDVEDSTPAPASGTPASESVFAELFADNIADATRTFNVNAAAGGMFISPRGTQLDFEPGAFTYEDGTPVTGSVTVSLVEALTVGDMIWLNKQTVGNDNGTLRILRSGGALNVYANQGSTPVRIANGGLIAKIPTSSPDPAMALFRGTENSDGAMIWDPVNEPITVDSAYYDSTDYTYTFPYQFYYNIAGNTDLNWLNCDYFASYPNTTIVSATIPAGQAPDSTAVWLALPSEPSVISMGYWAQDQLYQCWQAVPIGYQAVVVGLKQEANGYSSSFTPITITANMVVPMTFSPTTLQQFVDDVNAL
ncbi:MAG: hypothetical protein IPK70_05840 [Flavobacteriales bacterium]|jgi:hypothetical protein|nr:hypothetical protein [Flavobacteriales bacterium]